MNEKKKSLFIGDENYNMLAVLQYVLTWSQLTIMVATLKSKSASLLCLSAANFDTIFQHDLLVSFTSAALLPVQLTHLCAPECVAAQVARSGQPKPLTESCAFPV